MVQRTKEERVTDAHTDADERQNFQRRLMRHALLGGFKALNLLMHAAVFALSWQAMQSGYGPLAATSIMLTVFFAAVLYGVYKIYGAFHISLVKPVDIATAQTISLLIVYALCYFVECMMLRRIVNMRAPFLCLLCSVALTIVWSFVAHRMYYRIYSALKTIVLYDIPEAWNSVEGLYQQTRRFNVTSTIDVRKYYNCMDDLYERLAGTQAVFLCGIPSGVRNDILKYCINHGVRVYIRPQNGDVVLSGAKRMQMFHVPVLLCQRCQPSMLTLICKRATDIVLSGIALVILSPVYLAVAIAIKACDHGPVLYRQKRLTRNGRVFGILNLRRMEVVRIVHKIMASMRHDICLNSIADSHIHGFRHPNRGFVRSLIA